MPFANDMFFPVGDCAAEQAMIAGSELRVIKSLWAHFTMLCVDRQTNRRSTETWRSFWRHRCEAPLDDISKGADACTTPTTPR
jgi:hypothetical protein